MTVADVFSGGSQGAAPIPDGEYEILGFKSRIDRYRLESIDAVFGDDLHAASGRSEFRLHPRGLGINWGCISAANDSSWGVIETALQTTATSVTTVLSKPNRFGFGGGNAEAATSYGRLTVITSQPSPAPSAGVTHRGWR